MFFKKSKRAVDYTVTKSNRKTMSIIVEKNGEVRVLAPKRLNNNSIHAFVQEKEPWILEKLKVILQNKKDKPMISNGATIEIIGEIYTLVFSHVKNKKNEGVYINNRNLIFAFTNLDKASMATAFEKGLRGMITKLIEERVLILSKMMDVKPSKISIKDQKKRWGTCTSKGHVLFNWRLIFAPLPIIDYVVVHELAHLKHMDHSDNFWRFVSVYDPNFKMKREWLKKHGGFIDWSFVEGDIN